MISAQATRTIALSMARPPDSARLRRDHGLKKHAWRRMLPRCSGTWLTGVIPMSDLVVIVYPSEEKAEEVRKRLFELQRSI